jgi:hypothetical protein
LSRYRGSQPNYDRKTWRHRYENNFMERDIIRQINANRRVTMKYLGSINVISFKSYQHTLEWVIASIIFTELGNTLSEWWHSFYGESFLRDFRILSQSKGVYIFLGSAPNSGMWLVNHQNSVIYWW